MWKYIHMRLFMWKWRWWWWCRCERYQGRQQRTVDTRNVCCLFPQGLPAKDEDDFPNFLLCSISLNFLNSLLLSLMIFQIFCWAQFSQISFNCSLNFFNSILPSFDVCCLFPQGLPARDENDFPDFLLCSIFLNCLQFFPKFL